MKELKFEERRELAKKLNAWLGHYTDEVISRVMVKLPEILEDKTTMFLLDELYKRTEKEREESISNFDFYIREIEDDSFEKSLIHCNPLTHASSYRDILHDMWIK